MSHWLALQTAAPFAVMPHACPQLPQLEALLVVSAQLPVQLVSPPLQVAEQAPFEQASPGIHGF
jgi:hypothetical protein